YIYIPNSNIEPSPNNDNKQQTKQATTGRILRPIEVAKYLAITFLLLVANSVTFIYINPLMLSGGHDLSFVSIALLINGVAGMIGTSMG
ncbi:chloramphenicol resistance protein, partial [Staphylococcus pettenkoferi]